MQTGIRNCLSSTLFLALCVMPLGIASVLGGCTQQSSPPVASGSPLSTPPVPPTPAPQAAGLPRLEGKATVVMTVKGSPITIEIDGTDAPVTAGNFVDLVNRKFYDGLVFHRVVRGPDLSVVQGGDPLSKNPNIPIDRLGAGGSDRQIPLEIKPQNADQAIYGKTFSAAQINVPPKLRHTRGAVAMARSQDLNSASSQFYFALADLPFLDGDYAVFGYVKEGMEVIDKVQQGDRIESAKVTQGIENLKNTSTPSPSPTASPTTSP